MGYEKNQFLIDLYYFHSCTYYSWGDSYENEYKRTRKAGTAKESKQIQQWNGKNKANKSESDT